MPDNITAEDVQADLGIEANLIQGNRIFVDPVPESFVQRFIAGVNSASASAGTHDAPIVLHIPPAPTPPATDWATLLTDGSPYEQAWRASQRRRAQQRNPNLPITNADARGRIARARQFVTHTGNLRGELRPTYVDLGRLPEQWREQFHRHGGVTYVVFSYQTPIAWITTHGQRFIPPVKYSVTTSRHQNIVRDAWASYRITPNGKKVA